MNGWSIFQLNLLAFRHLVFSQMVSIASLKISLDSPSTGNCDQVCYAQIHYHSSVHVYVQGQHCLSMFEQHISKSAMFWVCTSTNSRNTCLLYENFFQEFPWELILLNCFFPLLRCCTSVCLRINLALMAGQPYREILLVYRYVLTSFELRIAVRQLTRVMKVYEIFLTCIMCIGEKETAWRYQQYSQSSGPFINLDIT